MTEIRDFDQPVPGTEKPLCSFRVGGRVWHSRSIGTLTTDPFAGIVDDEGNITAEVTVIYERFLALDEIDDFLALVKSNRSPVTVANAQAIATNLVNGVLKGITSQTRRPTRRPTSSSGGSRPKAGKSRAVSSSRATPRKRSGAST